MCVGLSRIEVPVHGASTAAWKAELIVPDTMRRRANTAAWSASASASGRITSTPRAASTASSSASLSKPWLMRG